MKRYIARKQPSRSPARVLFLLCEGKKTEPYYFDAIKRRFRGEFHDKYVINLVEHPHNDPIGIVEDAKKLNIHLGKSKK